VDESCHVEIWTTCAIVHAIMVLVDLVRSWRLSGVIVGIIASKRLVGGTRIRNCIRRELLMEWKIIGKGGTTVVNHVINSLIVVYILAKR